MTSPSVVAIGGGHGLAASIRAIRTYAASTTAIVATADDGGSSGRLRDAVVIPAPGDIRRCLVAMAAEGRWADTIEFRFRGGDVDGHAVGNLVLAALAEVTGDFVEACAELGRLLGLDPSVARVLPATNEAVLLRATTANGATVDGQVAISHTEGIERVELVPATATPPKDAVEAIADADQIVLGPGSLYTSVLAAAVVPEVRDAVASAAAARVYVCNLRAEVAETRGYDVGDHLRALDRHGVRVDVVVTQAGGLPLGDTAGARVVEAQVTRDTGLAHHPNRLGEVLADLVARR